MVQSLKETLRIYPSIWRKSWLFLIVFFISAAGIDLINQSVQSGSGVSSQAMAFEAVYFLINLLFDSFLFLFIPALLFCLTEERPVSQALLQIRRNLNQICIEFIRATASSIRWSLLFLLPGIFKQLRYYFVPYVVLFDAEYERGDRDALDGSDSLVRGRTWLVLLIFIVDLLLTSFADGYNQWSVARGQPLVYSVRLAVYAAYKVFLYCFLFVLYSRWSGMKTLKESPHVDRYI